MKSLLQMPLCIVVTAQGEIMVFDVVVETWTMEGLFR